LFLYLILITSTGWIDVHEFVGYMIKRYNAAKSRIYSMKHDSIFAIATNPGVRVKTKNSLCVCAFLYSIVFDYIGLILS